MLIGGKIGRVRDVAKAVGGRFSISIYFSFSVETNQKSDGIIHGSARNRNSELLSVSLLLLCNMESITHSLSIILIVSMN